MRLTKEELLELKEQKPVKCWRLLEPPRTEAGKSYSSAGEKYTVLTVEPVEQDDVMRRFGRAEYARLRDEHGRHWQRLWLIVVVYGDRTDGLRLLAPTGTAGGDYTNMPSRAMPEEPEAIDFETLAQFAKDAEPDREKRVSRRKKKQKRRSALNLLKKALDDS